MQRAFVAAFLAGAGCAGEDLDRDGVPASEDCNDADPGQLAPLPLYVDADGDGFAGDSVEIGCPGSGWLSAEATDCDDDDPAVHPEAVEVGCDGVDNDCAATTADGPAVTVGATWPSIQSAIDAAGYNEIVALCASTVEEDIVIDRPIELLGAGAGLTVVQGTGLGPVVQVASGLSGLVRISGVGIVGGTGLVVDGRTVGGGVLVTASLVVLDRVEVFDNEAADGGGVAVLGEATLLLTGSTVHDNQATDRGGGIYTEDATSVALLDSDVFANLAFEGGGWWLRGIATADATAVFDNHATFGGGVALDGLLETTHLVGLGLASVSANSALLGGGVYGVGDLTGLVVEGNDADHGGGIYATGPVALFQTELVANHALTGNGGGASISPGAVFVASDVSIVGNTAEAFGGGVYADGAELVLFYVTLESNVAHDGGGIAVVGTCLACTLDGTAVDVRYNTALGGGGGLAIAQPDATFTFSASRFHAGEAPRASAIAVVVGKVELDNSEVTAHVATDLDAAAVEVSAGKNTFVADGSPFTGNTPADVRVIPLASQVAPGPDFTCNSGSACTSDP